MAVPRSRCFGLCMRPLVKNTGERPERGSSGKVTRNEGLHTITYVWSIEDDTCGRVLYYHYVGGCVRGDALF